jgi:hypothetical protein
MARNGISLILSVKFYLSFALSVFCCLRYIILLSAEHPLRAVACLYKFNPSLSLINEPKLIIWVSFTPVPLYPRSKSLLYSADSTLDDDPLPREHIWTR